MAQLTKEQKELQRKRAIYEFNLRVYQLIANYKSKEEPTVKLSFGEKIAALAVIVGANIDKLENKKAWQK